MKLLSKDNQYQVFELDNGMFKARIMLTAYSVERVFQEYEAMESWVNEFLQGAL